MSRLITVVGAAPWVPFDSTAAEQLARIAVRIGYAKTTGDFMKKITDKPTATLMELVVYAAAVVTLAPAVPAEVASIDPLFRFELDLTGIYIPSFVYTGANAGGIFSNNVLIEGYNYTGFPGGQPAAALSFFQPGHAASNIKFFAGYFPPGATVRVSELIGGDVLAMYEATASAEDGYLAYCVQTAAPSVVVSNFAIAPPALGNIGKIWFASICP